MSDWYPLYYDQHRVSVTVMRRTSNVTILYGVEGSSIGRGTQR